MVTAFAILAMFSFYSQFTCCHLVNVNLVTASIVQRFSDEECENTQHKKAFCLVSHKTHNTKMYFELCKDFLITHITQKQIIVASSCCTHFFVRFFCFFCCTRIYSIHYTSALFAYKKLNMTSYSKTMRLDLFGGYTHT